MFVDKVNLVLKAGDGGKGALSFRHEKFIDKGGPDGGDGGSGGNIVLIASRNQNTLAAFRYKKLLKAANGGAGDKRRRHGKNGEDLEIVVPVGTVITNEDNGQVLTDLPTDGQEIVLLKGGRGGYGNAHFISSTRQTPRVAEKGEPGETVNATIELKMIADVGLVGLPNAGKSTLLSVISNAKPEIADYAFTTLQPNLGVVDIDNRHSLLFADIPGLIEGASQGKGLGDEFLRHVERTSVLVHLIDAYSQDITGDYRIIMAELAAYKVDISKRPQIVAVSKIDGLDKKRVSSQVNKLKKVVPKGVSILAISSSSKEGVKALLRDVQKLVEKNQKKTLKKAKQELPVIGLKDDPNSWNIQKQPNGFIVVGGKIESFARRTDFDDRYGRQRIKDIMKKMGIIKELERHGIKPEETIRIGDPEIGRLEY
jgi:GTP-binding protein